VVEEEFGLGMHGFKLRFVSVVPDGRNRKAGGLG
jgi:hypothetical protein